VIEYSTPGTPTYLAAADHPDDVPVTVSVTPAEPCGTTTFSDDQHYDQQFNDGKTAATSHLCWLDQASP